MLIKKRAVLYFLAFTMLLGLLTFTSATANAQDINSCDELSSAIADASTDGTETVINIKQDITIASTITLPVGTNIKLVGDGGKIAVTSFPAFTDGAAGHVTLSFQDLNIKGTEPSQYTGTTAIFTGLTGSTLKIYGTSHIDHDGYIANKSKSRNNPTLYIFGGTIKSSPHNYGTNDSTLTYLYPTANISIEGKAISFNCAAQENYPVTNLSASVDGAALSAEDITTLIAGIKNATATSPYFLKLVDSNTPALVSLQISVGSGGSSEDPSTYTAAGGTATINGNSVDYAWSYGGCVTEKDGTFTITPYQSTDKNVNYVIDTVYVDGAPAAVTDKTVAMTVSNAAKSVFATFAYTVNFQNPANGTLSVSRNGTPLTSGDIVRGGDVLTITANGTSAAYVLDQLSLTGITKNGDGTYTVTAQNSEATPAISATMRQAITVAAPTFSVAAGKVAANTPLTITTTTEGASVYYTTDGTAPSTINGTLYSGPVSITADMTLKAVAVLNGYPDSEVTTAAYTVDTTPRSIYVSGSNYAYSVWVNGTALTENSGAGGTDKEYKQAAKPGDTVEFTVTPAVGYKVTRMVVTEKFDSTTQDITPACDGTTGKYTFTMPVGSARITPTISAVKTVTVADGITGGTVTTDATDGTTADTVTVTATPDSGYHLKSISYSYDGTTWTKAVPGTGQLTFAPTANVTVKAEFAEGANISIANADELKTFAASVNAGDAYIGAAVTLSGDIALTGEWTPIGSSNAPFEGTFDGGGHTVSGLQITKSNWTYTGLFGIAGTVKNLTVAGSITAAGGAISDNIGGVAGSADTLTGCTSVVDISAGVGCVGGVAGSASGASNCKNYGTLTIAVSGQEAYNVGGILGTTTSAYPVITECANYGSIAFDGGTYTLTDSKTGATITGNAASGYFGGMVGATGGGSTSITNSCNKGSITGDMRMAGGLVGEANGVLTVTNCYSTGAITETGDDSNKTRVRLGGLVGSSNYNKYDLTLESSYCTGQVTAQKSSGYISVGELHCNTVDNDIHGGGTATTTATNSYGAGQKLDITVSKLGGAYKADSAAAPVNGGNPLLQWESDTVSDTKYTVTISTAPAAAAVTVYSDAAMETAVGTGSGYELKAGTYYYRVVADGYGTETGSFTVSIRPISVTVTLRKAEAVTFAVNPADASFAVTDAGGKTVTATSSSGGTYSYTLYTGNTYRYSASATGYNSTTREYIVSGSAIVTVSLTASSQTPGTKTISPSDTPYTISAGGTYSLTAGDYKSGYLYINTTEPVILVGSGVGMSSMCEDLHIVCQKSGVQLTLSNVYLSNTDQITNMINYQGSGNTLNFEGVSILDQDTGASGYAMVHVNTTTSLTVSGGTAYFYKRDQGAGIGGNGGAKGSEGQAPEYNGSIRMENATLFMKNSKQGACIGSGADAKSTNFTPGSIAVEDSTLNLIAISRGSAIGGAAGSSGGAQGANLTVSNSSININVDWSGAAIGGGGYDGGNDSSGGTLNYESGSIRTFIDTNAVGSWGVFSAGVNGNKAITAAITTNGKAAYLLTLDTGKLTKNASSFTVKDGSRTVYSGGLHQYRYVNENTEKTGQALISYTIDNWTALDDSNLYLYLTGADHTLTVNGETVNATWSSTAKTFTLKYASGSTSNITEPSKTTTTTVELTPTTKGTTSTAAITQSAMADTLSKALAAAKEAGTGAGLEIKVNAPTTATEVRTGIPTASVASAVSEGITTLSVNTPVGTVQLNTAALSSVAQQAGSNGSVTVSVKKVDTTTLTAEQQKLVSGGTVVEVGITAGSQSVTRLGGGTAAITVPAGTVKSDQTARVYYLNSRGQLILMPGSYDAEDNTVTYSTPHLSKYVVLTQNKQTGSFKDVASTAWCADAVEFASVSGLFQGTSTTTFSPNASMTRAMLVSVLWRMEGKPAGAKSANFSDVTADAWYADAVNWATANGIVGGYTAETFGPSKQVTRQQLAAILARFAKYCGYDVSGTADLGKFTDQAQIGSFAKAGMAWAVNEGLISGTTSTTLVPGAVTTRAQVATILMRYQQKAAI